MERDHRGHRWVVIEGVHPEIDCGRFPIKRVIGEQVRVEADVFAEGHDVVDAVLLHRHASEQQWQETPMTFLVNDRWFGLFQVTVIGSYLYTLLAWVDHFRTWRRDLKKKVVAEQDVSTELLAGAQLIEEAAGRVLSGPAGDRLAEWAAGLRADRSLLDRIHLALDEELAALMKKRPDRSHAARYDRELVVTVDRKKARCSTWYEMFPRSCAAEPERHGTFKDCEQLLPYVADMSFDVLYFPPIHPIGKTHRKGRNNSPTAAPGEPGSPWAIGASEGGHKAVDPRLGTLDDFRRLVKKASGYGLEIAMDLAFQCTPDHPYVKEHPEWFKWRPDGTIQYAENPPKKYQDIYPINFETEAWWELWQELRDVVFFWIDQGIRIFRVDNPHTKPFGFWEWLIHEVKKPFPETLFLSEAFTRPKVMYHLAKLGFTQSYTYFAWRNTSWELRQYFTELDETGVREFFQPNLWPNTPDILTEYLQMGGRAACMARLVLAATLGASYGPANSVAKNIGTRRNTKSESGICTGRTA
jgi:starch synthase (maltosyl-transferring)